MTLERLDRPEMRPTALDSDSDSELTDRLVLEMADEPSELPEENSDTPLDRSDWLLLVRCCNRLVATAVATGTSYSSPRVVVEDNGVGLLVPFVLTTNRGVS